MVEIDYQLVLDVNRAYAVLGSESKLDSVFEFLKQNDLEAVYEEADIPEEHRDIQYHTVREFDMSDPSEAQDCIDFLGKSNFSQDVLVRVRNADQSSEEHRESLEHRIKGFHESNSYMTDGIRTCVLVSGVDRLTKYDRTLSGRIFSPHRLL